MPAPPTLFDSLIDYAGLFPPAKLAMAAAVRQHAAHLGGPHATLLGRFVVPLARLAEFETEYLQLPAPAGWRLSVLAGPDPAADFAAIESFNTRQRDARIVALEPKAGTVAEIAQISAAFPASFELWVEVPASGDVTPLLATIKAAGRHAKIRTGGVTAEAFPSADTIARFLAAGRDTGVTCKATAGLHHPLRGEFPLTYEPAGPRATMFGFLNLFLAATLLHHGGSLADATGLLNETDPGSFTVSAAAIQWRRHSFTSAQISAARQSLCRSFGSCSFTEPVEGLQALHWL